MQEYEIPLIIRGNVIRDNLVTFEGRRGKIAFRTPDVKQYLDQIVLRNPSEMGDLYKLGMSDILDYLDELGTRLAPAVNPHIRTAIDISAATSGHSRDMLNYMYGNMRHILSRDFVTEAVETNVGIAALDGWVRRELSDRVTEVRAMGARSVHINAGNGAVISLQGIMMNAVLRSDAIMKSPSNDPYTAAAVALTMIEMAPNHPLTKHLTIAYWKGGDAAFEKRLYQPKHVEKVIAWGGFASMEHIRGYLGPGMDLIALDPKISGSIIGKEAFANPRNMQAAALALAKDVGYFNQEGCISSRLAYVQCGTDPEEVAKLNTFGEMVYGAIQELPGYLSTPHPAFDPRLREEMSAIRCSDSFKIVGGKGAEGAVIISQENEAVDFSDHLGCRVVNLVPIDEVSQGVARVTIHTATVGIYPEALKAEIRTECALRGAQRITTLGFSTAEGAAQPHDALEQMRRMARWIVCEYFEENRSENVGWVHGGDGTQHAAE